MKSLIAAVILLSSLSAFAESIQFKNLKGTVHTCTHEDFPELTLKVKIFTDLERKLINTNKSIPTRHYLGSFQLGGKDYAFTGRSNRSIDLEMSMGEVIPEDLASENDIIRMSTVSFLGESSYSGFSGALTFLFLERKIEDKKEMELTYINVNPVGAMTGAIDRDQDTSELKDYLGDEAYRTQGIRFTSCRSTKEM